MKATEDIQRPERPHRRGDAVAGRSVSLATSRPVPGALLALVAAETAVLAGLLASGNIPASLITIFRALLAL